MPHTLEHYFESIEPNLFAIEIVGPFAGDMNPQTPVKVYVDRGADFRNRDAGNLETGFSVGDGDSSRSRLDQTLPEQKDHSDLAYVLKKIPDRFTKILLNGFLGGRKDHELMNLAEVHRMLKVRAHPTQVDFDKAVRAFSAGRWRCEVHGIFSLFAFERVEISIKGDCKYPVHSKQVFCELSSQGLSNIGNGLIEVQTDGPVFLFLENEQKF